MNDERKGPGTSANEGEGNKNADTRYREAATDFAKRTDTQPRGMKAERDVENYRDKFDRAYSSSRWSVERSGPFHSTCFARGRMPKALSKSSLALSAAARWPRSRRRAAPS